MILAPPPDAVYESLVSGDDPLAGEAVECPDESAVPRRTNSGGWLAVVVNRDRPLRAGFLWRDHGDEERVPIAPGTELESILDDAVDDERHLEIDLHLSPGLDYAVSDRVIAADAAVSGIYLDVQIVEARIPP